ncbi:PadR family transcriptional regulator [bacterium D16-51]|nr:PadR family transcriptional regulator [bacterium D16-59]RKI62156.1 PadR family transcriptional regulator [bacterium D16-51]
MANKNNLIMGITNLLVLAILENGDSYVYEITKTIAAASNELLSISQNTIYTVTYKLEEDHLISEYSKLVGKKRTRVYYHIEQKGRDYLDKLLSDYENMINGVQNIFDALKNGGE